MARKIIDPQFKQVLRLINGTPKSATMLVLAEDRLTSPGIHEKITVLTGTDENLPKKSAFGHYCKDSLSPNGFVDIEKEEVKKREITYFKPTEMGNGLGKAVAGFSLDWEYTHKSSLAQILGENGNSSDSKGPENRAGILLHLDSSPMNLKQLEQIMGINISIAWRHARELEQKGLVSISEDKSNKKVSLNGNGRRFLDELIYPLWAGVYSKNSLGELYEVAEMLTHHGFAKQILSSALLQHQNNSGKSHPYRRAEVEAKILAQVKSNPGITPSQMSSALGISNIGFYLPKIIESDKIRSERGRYYLTSGSEPSA